MQTRTVEVSDLTDLILWLPTGAAFWRDIGGPASLSGEERLLRAVEYRLRDLTWIQAGGKKAGKRPEPPKDPEYAHEKRNSMSVMSRKATAFLRRQSRGDAVR